MNSNTMDVGEYEFDQSRKIGTGSFATVYAGRLKADGMLVAVKAVEMRKLNKKLRQNLQVEINIMREHTHPNLVKLHAVERAVDEQHAYLVMEYCAGGDLAAFLKKRGGHVPESTARRFMKQIAKGIAYLQSHNLIHRDLKPHNLLLTKDSTAAVVKIADFGFARLIQPTTLADTMCGSPLYMAPEVLSSMKYDLKADLWSSGTILFQMISGKPPYHGDNYIHLLENIKKKKWSIPESFANTISDECKDLLARLLQKDPTIRISADECLVHPFFDGVEEPVIEGVEGARAEALVEPVIHTSKAPVQVQPLSSNTTNHTTKLASEPKEGGPSNIDLQLNLERNNAPKLNVTRTKSELSDDYVLVASPPPGPFKRGGLVLQKGESGECLMMDSIDRVVSHLMKCGPNPSAPPAASKLDTPQPNSDTSNDFDLADANHSQATVVMEIANAMVQHNPRDALALFVKCLQLLENVIQNPTGNHQHLEEAKQLFTIVYDKAESLTKELPDNGTGQTAQEILYECALAMGREAASFELLTDSQMARKHYGIAFACLHLLRTESTSETDNAVLDQYLTQVELRAKELASQEAASQAAFN